METSMMSVKNNNIILFKKFDKLCEKADLVFNFFGEKKADLVCLQKIIILLTYCLKIIVYTPDFFFHLFHLLFYFITLLFLK